MPRKGDILKLNIESLSFGGYGFAKHNGIAIFVEKGLPGQKVEAFIFRKQKKFYKARINRVISETAEITDAKCTHFDDCGGCSFQTLNYEQQISEKYNQVVEILNHIGKFRDIKVSPILKADNIYNYRNKMEFAISNNPWYEKYNPVEKKDFCIGLHPKGRYDKTIDILNCDIQSIIANKVVSIIRRVCIHNKILAYDITSHTGFMRQVVIRSSDYSNETMIIFVTSFFSKEILKPLINELSKLKEIKSIINNVNSKKADISKGTEQHLLYGRDYIFEKLGNYKFKISPDSFFQTNTKQSKKLYDIIKSEADLRGHEIVYDLYCGTGTIGIYLSKKAKKVYGFEIVSSAINDAIINASENNINNALFFNKDIKDILKDSQINQIEKPDVSIIDPPRAGLHPKALKNIINLNQKKLIYISCNPSTQARDLKEFVNNNYKIKKIQPVDMFPHTPHIESVVTLANESN